MALIETTSAPLPVAGIRLGTAAAGIKRADRDDILVIEAAPGSTCAAVFTQNAFCAAPVRVARDHLPHEPRWLLINSGNANAGTGQRGLDDSRACCAYLAEQLGASPAQVLPFSTGVIGEYLPIDKIRAALPQAARTLAEDNWERAARAIMTTDTRPKTAWRRVEVGGHCITVTGIAKGAGMIHPNMATMLAFLATDARVPASDLQACLSDVADATFNCITVDGDTSTNDACVLLASGAVGGAELTQAHPDFPVFRQALLDVCQSLAEAIIRDGEGATKFIRIHVEGATDRTEALTVGKTVAHSPLVKTACFASDPNWGRILAAVGRAGCANLDIDRIDIWLGDTRIVAHGGRAPTYQEADGAALMAKPEIDIRIELGRGHGRATVFTCDFSYDYVRINAEYRT